MKEKDVRDKVNTLLTSTAGLGSHEPTYTVMYMAQFPPLPGGGGWGQADFIPYIPVPVDQIPEPAKHPAPKVDKCELDELILGVLALKGQTVEIFKLKALAVAIKERVEKVL